MLIVCTKDPIIVRTAQDPTSGARQWGELVVIDPSYNQAQATAVIESALRRLDGPLCFSAHGNDEEIGDAENGPIDWGWTCAQLAAILQNSTPRAYTGPILIHACAEHVSNFSAGLAVALGRIRALNGTWIYGYNRAVPSAAGFPAPANMDKDRSLQATQVWYSAPQPATAHASVQHPVMSFAGYRATFPSGYTVELPQGFDATEVRRLIGILAEGPLR